MLIFDGWWQGKFNTTGWILSPPTSNTINSSFFVIQASSPPAELQLTDSYSILGTRPSAPETSESEPYSHQKVKSNRWQSWQRVEEPRYKTALFSQGDYWLPGDLQDLNACCSPMRLPHAVTLPGVTLRTLAVTVGVWRRGWNISTFSKLVFIPSVSHPFC